MGAGVRAGQTLPLWPPLSLMAVYEGRKKEFLSHTEAGARGRKKLQTPPGSGHQTRARWVLGPASRECTGTTAGEEDMAPAFSTKAAPSHYGASLTAASRDAPGGGGTKSVAPICSARARWHLPPLFPQLPAAS